MTKRNPTTAPRERDYWPTPPEAVQPLLPHLAPGTIYCEPMAGNGALIDALAAAGHVCEWALDLAPQRNDVLPVSCFDWLPESPEYITNPPWTRTILHAAIELLPRSWLLFDADWMHTGQAAHLLDRCERIVSVGRVKWIAGSKSVGFDNCCWYRFDAEHTGGPRFYPRLTDAAKRARGAV